MLVLRDTQWLVTMTLSSICVQDAVHFSIIELISRRPVSALFFSSSPLPIRHQYDAISVHALHSIVFHLCTNLSFSFPTNDWWSCSRSRRRAASPAGAVFYVRSMPDVAPHANRQRMHQTADGGSLKLPSAGIELPCRAVQNTVLSIHSSTCISMTRFKTTKYCY